MTGQSKPTRWADIKFPPINLWSAPTTKAMARARTESLKESLQRLGYDSYWVRNRQYNQYMMRVRKFGNAGEFYLMSPKEVTEMIEREESEKAGV